MADATLPPRADRPRALAILARLGAEPGGYVVATSTARRTRGRSRLGAHRRRPRPRSTEPVVFPAHPRTRAALERAGSACASTSSRSSRSATSTSPRWPRRRASSSPTRAGSRRRRTGTASRASPLRPTTEWVDTVERARTCSSTTIRTRSRPAVEAAPLPAERPQLYGDGYAARSDRRPARYPSRAVSEQPQTRAGDGTRRAPWTSPSSAPATSASRWRRLRRRRAARCCSSTSCPTRGRRAQPRREPHRGRARLDDARAARRRRAPRARRPTTTSSATADAILIALPTPLSQQREPDLSDRRARGASDIAPRLRARAPRRARVDDVPGHDARGQLLPDRSSATGLKAGEDFHLAFSPERVDPGRERLDDAQRCRRSSAASRPPAPSARGRRSTRRRVDTRAPRLVARGRRADEAAREHLPLGQHRARQRARAALRPDGHRRLGGRRRRRDEAVRVHDASSPGPGLGGHCIPIDPFYLTWKAREYGFYTRVHRARRRDQRAHAVLLPLARSRRRSTTARRSRSRARASSCSASPTSRTSATCASRRR